MILAGDIGGTKVHLALYDLLDGRLKLMREARFASRQVQGLEQIVGRFVAEDKITVASFGVPGPEGGERRQTANPPWMLDRSEISASLGIQQVYLLNDLEANGYGIAGLSANQMLTLNEGEPKPTGTRALIAAGSGLGEGFLTWDGRAHVPYASEGGHMDFAPRNADECGLWHIYPRPARWETRVLVM